MVALLLCACYPRTLKATAADHDTPGFGLGIILGEPAGVGVRYWFSSELSGQLWLGGTWWHRGAQLSTDLMYAVRDFVPLQTSDVQLDLSFGAGAALGVWTDVIYCFPRPSTYCETRNRFALALRGPVTTSLFFSAVPLELFVELAPSLLLQPHVGFKLDAGLGLRYYL